MLVVSLALGNKVIGLCHLVRKYCIALLGIDLPKSVMIIVNFAVHISLPLSYGVYFKKD